VLDFTSALYLGLRHPSSSLRPWSRLTTGKPAILAPQRGAGLARELAALQGLECAVLAPSTLHLFWDLFGVLAREPVRIYMDAATYAIGRWGVERAANRGVPVRTFAHHDAIALERAIAQDRYQDHHQDRHSGRRPIVVADGYCPACGQPLPIADYLQCLAPHQGRLVIDDTQAIGVLGAGANLATPYGRGGGGSLPWQRIASRDVIVGSSLAKGFGVPLAVLAGDKAVVRRFEDFGETRVHSSPPSSALLRAAEHALVVNRQHGDRRRRHLAALVRRFRTRLHALGLSSDGGTFPVVSVRPVGITAETLHLRLLALGIRTVVVRCCRGLGRQVMFLITALHHASDIDRAADAIARAFTSPVTAKAARAS
jgi:8-amino-7-oxononanoate synthase